MAEPAYPPRGAVARLSLGLALLGGFVLLGIAGLVTWSVVQRWLIRQPVPGDFELVSLGSALAVFGFLAYGTLMRANILVDSFTQALPAGQLGIGAMETRGNHTTTMVLGLPTWWAMLLGALGFAAAALAALYWSARFARGRA